MSTYTTGDVAKLCGVSVRTIQYYDRQGLLNPSSMSTGGKRLYDDADVRALEYILMLKDTGLSLAAIRTVMESPYSTRMLQDLLGEQRQKLESGIAEAQRRITAIDALDDDLALHGTLTVADRTDMANHMASKTLSHRFFALMIIVSILADIAWIGTLVWSIHTGIWWIFSIGLAAAVIMMAAMTASYYRHVVYWDPATRREFRPAFWSWFFARHTLHTRLLRAPGSNEKVWCVEHFQGRVPVRK
ncbi:MerR family transcriptional regulator [Bifidobacterium choloepi]|uniref:MerR family transcriptional regulator n=1 Tax=Bifidobacterium choloepi TaxID=2614131 RepID=UPI0013D18240|nr:MerR family transcriptional regulator [Bifidobacterium choloepi]